MRWILLVLAAIFLSAFTYGPQPLQGNQGYSGSTLGPQPLFSAPPGGCSNSLDFSQACNSQYVGLVM